MKPRIEWVERCRELLDEQVETIDYATRSRLNQARQHALAQLQQVRRQRWGWWLGSAVAASLAAFFAVNLWLSGPTVDGSSLDELLAENPAELDLELLVASDSLELYENLEFYAWLQSQPVDG